MPGLPVFACSQDCAEETNNGHIVNLSVRKPYLVVDMVLNFGAAPCGQAGGGVYGGGTERERERDVDNKLCNLFTYSKQLNLVSACSPTGILARDDLGLIFGICSPGSGN